MIKYSSLGPHDFSVSYPKVDSFGTPKEELQKIFDKLPQDLIVMASGGIDSEVMARLLIEAGKNVTAVAYNLRYENKTVNEHDIAWVEELSGHCELKYKYFNLKEFWEGKEFDMIVKNFKCTSPQLPIHLYIARWWAATSKKLVILPSIHPEPKHFRDTTFVQEREKDYAIAQAFGKSNVLVSPLKSSPGIIASILNSNEFKNFHTYGLVDGRSRKPQQYKEYFDIEVKPRPKYHGFEGSEDLDNGMRQKIWDKYKHSEVHMYIPANEMLENMKAGEFTYSSDKYLKIMYDECHMIGPAQ